MLIISTSSINKLGHEIPEIRVRTLKHIEGKLTRALLQNENITFNPGSLIKQLIRWFGQIPLCEEETVLNLSLVIFQSKYIHETIKYLGLERLKREFAKVYEIIKRPHHRKFVTEIRLILDNYEELDDNNLFEFESFTTSDRDTNTIDTLEIIDDDFSPDYEKPWSTPSIPDYNSLKLLCDSLTSDVSEADLQYAFKYLKTAINDYPAEYFLQPPYIFKALLVLYMKDKTKSELLLRNLIQLTKSILGRIKKRQLAKTFNYEEYKIVKSSTQISTSRFCTELFNLCHEHLKELSECSKQNESVLTFTLLIELINLIEINPSMYNASRSFLIDLGYVAKYYRQSIKTEFRINRINRMHYVIILNLISRLVNLQNKTGSYLTECEIDLTKRTDQKKQYNPNNYLSTSLNSAIGRQDVQNENEIWFLELKNALLDFPLKEFFPEYYNVIKKAIKLDEKYEINDLKILLDCEQNLTPAIKLLRQPDNFSDEEFILNGLEAIDTITIHRSLDLVEKIIDAISKSIPLYAGNRRLKDNAENILLRLFANEDIKIKRLVYKTSADRMKYYFGCLMNGEITLNQGNTTISRNTSNFGIPLTISILTEIICFGYDNPDVSIHKNAETMLCLIMKGKSILHQHWEGIQAILLPNLPLLQCIATKVSDLGRYILDFLDPDNNIPNLDMIQGNLRLLFSEDSLIRKEALSRISYILSTNSEAHLYIPNILEISDTLSEDICLLNAPRDPDKIFSGGLYERSTIYALIELLKSKDVEPSIRKTTLMQLNVICQDPDLNDLIHDENGWFFALQALENSLRKNHTIDYPDSAISAIGIISKITLCNPRFRREIANEENIYLLFIRALFLFPNDISFQNDCVLGLFLLLFNSYIIGSKNISLPKIFSKLKLPIKCKFHWDFSPHNKKTELEEIYMNLIGKYEPEISSASTTTTRTSLTESDNKITSNLTDRYSRLLKNDNKRLEIKNNNFSDKDFDSKNLALQFIRMGFGTIWFNGFDILIQESSKNHELDYSIIQNHILSTTNQIELLDTLKFHKNLHLTKDDLQIIKCTSPTENINYFLRKIANATNHMSMLISVSGIEICLMILSTKKYQLNEKNLIIAFRKILITPPNNDLDILLYENILELIEQLIQLNNNEIILWILNDLKEKHCVLLSLLQNIECSISLYQRICEFLKKLIKKCINYEKKGCLENYLIDETNNNYNFYNKLFEFCLPITEKCFHKRHLDRVRCLLSLLQYLSASKKCDLDSGFIIIITKKLLYFIMTLKSFTQAGSHLSKNCLLIIGNLMDGVDEFILDVNHIKFLSGLCGHADYEIRSLAWCVLGKISKCLKGAHLLIKELSFLPGGFHACCLSTLLDNTETPIVRVTAGCLLSNLLTYLMNGTLHLAVAPLCIELEPSEFNNGYDLIIEIFRRYRFYDRIVESLDYFYISDIVLEQPTNELTTCDLIRVYCSILINFIDLNSSIINELCEKHFIIRIINLIKLVPQCITKSSLEMIGEICNLLIRFLQPDSKFLQRIIIQDSSILSVFINLLDLNYYEKQSKNCLLSILQCIQVLANETIAFQQFCELFSRNNFENIILLLIDGISEQNNIDYQTTIMEFFISLLIKSQSEMYKFTTFHQLLDTIELNQEIVEKECISLENLTNFSSNKKKIKTNFDQKLENSFKYGIEILFIKLKQQFANHFPIERIQNIKSSTKQKQLLSESIGVLLKTSEKSRLLANNTNFLNSIILRFQIILKEMGLNSFDFLRKTTDSKALQKDSIANELSMLFGIILNWYSIDCLTKEVQILDLTKIILKFWPWIKYSQNLCLIIFQCLAFLSEDSIPVCKQFSNSIPNHSHTILQLIVSFTLAETSKVKQINVDIEILNICLRIIANCCCCIEGRLQIVKLNLLEIFNRFHPSITKLHKSYNPIIILWLKFWEIFSRHSEGSQARNIILLCNLIVKAIPQIRFLSLKILRNMAFLNTNRAIFTSSDDFKYICQLILNDGSHDEQLLISIALWRLIAGNCKAKNYIKSTKIPSNLKVVLKNLTISNNSKENDDLFNVIEILLKVLYD